MTAAVALGALLASTTPAIPASPPRGPIRRVETHQPAVAITFDACATSKQSNGFDRAVYEILKREGIPATIFVSGRWVELHANEMTELARDPLVLFGDHSYDHPHMPRLTQAR